MVNTKTTAGPNGKAVNDLLRDPGPNSITVLDDSYFKDNMNVGLSGLSTEDVPIPTLSVIQSGSKMKDPDGRPYTPGKLYHKALKQEFDTVNCSILVITKKDMPQYEKRDQLERTYVILGVIFPGQTPFMMYNKSSAYFSTRQFIGEVRANKTPMYVLKVKITTEARQNDLGDWFVPVFNIVGKHEDSNVILALENLAKEYDMNRENIMTGDETQEAGQNNISTEVNVDDVPF